MMILLLSPSIAYAGGNNGNQNKAAEQYKRQLALAVAHPYLVPSLTPSPAPSASTGPSASPVFTSVTPAMSGGEQLTVINLAPATDSTIFNIDKYLEEEQKAQIFRDYLVKSLERAQNREQFESQRRMEQQEINESQRAQHNEQTSCSGCFSWKKNKKDRSEK